MTNYPIVSSNNLGANEAGVDVYFFQIRKGIASKGVKTRSWNGLCPWNEACNWKFYYHHGCGSLASCTT